MGAAGFGRNFRRKYLENDRRRGGGKDSYNALQCPKEYVLFTASEGAGEHCEAGAREVFFKRCLIGSIPSWPDEHVWLTSAQRDRAHAHKGRVVLR